MQSTGSFLMVIQYHNQLELIFNKKDCEKQYYDDKFN